MHGPTLHQLLNWLVLVPHQKTELPLLVVDDAHSLVLSEPHPTLVCFNIEATAWSLKASIEASIMHGQKGERGERGEKKKKNLFPSYFSCSFLNWALLQLEFNSNQAPNLKISLCRSSRYILFFFIFYVLIIASHRIILIMDHNLPNYYKYFSFS